MALTKYKLGELIQLCENKNSELKYGIDDVRGISIKKMFIETKADMQGVSLKPYYLVKPDDFVYVTVTSRNGEKITLAHNITEMTYIVSSSYVVFKVCRSDLLLSDYLFMYFNRTEFDRYSRFNSWGSARETFAWEDMCDIDIELPPIDIQQKFVDIYNGMVANQQAYESGLEDLKLVCDVFIENLRRQMPCEAIGPYIEAVNESNVSEEYNYVQGVESTGSFMNTRANLEGVDLSNYTIVRNNNIAYNPSRINLGSIAMYLSVEPCIVSPMYSVFKVIDTETIIPEYLMLWFGRSEFQRYTLYYAAGSVRDTFDFNLMKEVVLPIPSIDVQWSIVNIYNVYKQRKQINEKLKAQIKEICPVLVKGSLEEAQKGE